MLGQVSQVIRRRQLKLTQCMAEPNISCKRTVFSIAQRALVYLQTVVLGVQSVISFIGAMVLMCLNLSRIRLCMVNVCQVSNVNG